MKKATKHARSNKKLALFISRNAASIRGDAAAIAFVDPDGSNVADVLMPRQIRDSHVRGTKIQTELIGTHYRVIYSSRLCVRVLLASRSPILLIQFTDRSTVINSRNEGKMNVMIVFSRYDCLNK